MKKTLLFGGMLLMGTMSLNAQSVYEKAIYKSSGSEGGDMVLKDNLIAKFEDTTDIVATGDYNHNQEEPDHVQRIVLTKHDASGVAAFKYDYEMQDASGRPYDSYSNSVAQDNDGYIMVGKISGNAYHGSTVSDGGDVLIVKTNNSGTIVNIKTVDVQGDDIAYAIKPTGYNTDKFLISGSTDLGDSTRSFIMEIDGSLNVNWLTEMDLRITSAPTVTELYDVDTDGTYVWGVGYIRNTTSANTDGLVVQLNSSGSYLTSRRVYEGTAQKEKFKHVDMDGSNLAIAGESIYGKLVQLRRMIALKYTTSTHTIPKALWLKSGLNEDTGNDILRENIGGSVNYFVVGEAFPSSGSNRGVLYTFNSNFDPVQHRQYGGSGDSGIKAIDIYNIGSSGSYLGMVGYYNSVSGYQDGYLLKSRLSGYTSCEDSLGRDTTHLHYTLVAPDDAIYTDYTTDTTYSERANLNDSTVCRDTSTMRIVNPKSTLNGSNEDKTSIYPNPVQSNGIISIDLNEAIEVKEVKLVNSLGKVVHSVKLDKKTRYFELSVEQTPPGLYHLYILKQSDEDQAIEPYKLIVE